MDAVELHFGDVESAEWTEQLVGAFFDAALALGEQVVLWPEARRLKVDWFDLLAASAALLAKYHRLGHVRLHCLGIFLEIFNSLAAEAGVDDGVAAENLRNDGRYCLVAALSRIFVTSVSE